MPKWDAYTDTDAYSNGDSDADCNSHSHCNANSYPCRDTASYSDPKGSSHAAAAPVIFSPLTLKRQ